MFWVEWREMRQDTTYLPRPGDKVVSDTSRADASCICFLLEAWSLALWPILLADLLEYLTI